MGKGAEGMQLDRYSLSRIQQSELTTLIRASCRMENTNKV